MTNMQSDKRIAYLESQLDWAKRHKRNAESIANDYDYRIKDLQKQIDYIRENKPALESATKKMAAE